MGNKEIFDQMAGRYETPERMEIAAMGIRNAEALCVDLETEESMMLLSL